LRPQFDELRRQYDSFAKRYGETLAEILPSDKNRPVDVVAFSLTLFHKLSSTVDRDIALRALDMLNSWIEFERIEKRLSAKTKNGKAPVDVAEGISDLVAEIRTMGSEGETPSKQPAPETGKGLTDRGRRDIQLCVGSAGIGQLLL